MQLNATAIGNWVVWWWDDWSISPVTDEPWLSVRLMHVQHRIPKSRRRAYVVGWNGTRFARNSDAEKLEERYPGDLEALAERFRETHPAPSANKA